MTTRPMPPIRAALLALTLAYGPAALAGEVAPYPIWWSPELELESLDLIDWQLQWEFPRGQQFHLVTYGLERVYTDELIDPLKPELGFNWDIKRIDIKEQWIDSCVSLIEWTDKGFEIDHESPYWVHALNMHALHSVKCYALQALKQAKPAVTSYVRKFAFDENAMDYIPPMIGMGWDCKGLIMFTRANRDGVSWREFIPRYFRRKDPIYVVTVIDQLSIVVDRIRDPKSQGPENIYNSARITVIGQGDFDNDGLDDLLIKWEEQILTSVGELFTRFSALYIATRKETDIVFRVVDLIGSPPSGLTGRCEPRNSIIESGQDQ